MIQSLRTSSVVVIPSRKVPKLHSYFASTCTYEVYIAATSAYYSLILCKCGMGYDLNFLNLFCDGCGLGLRSSEVLQKDDRCCNSQCIELFLSSAAALIALIRKIHFGFELVVFY